jgi:hypothetical protein
MVCSSGELIRRTRAGAVYRGDITTTGARQDRLPQIRSAQKIAIEPTTTRITVSIKRSCNRVGSDKWQRMHAFQLTYRYYRIACWISSTVWRARLASSIPPASRINFTAAATIPKPLF